MRIQQTCPYCMRDAFASTGLQSLIFQMEQQQLTDSGIHPVRCNKGHEFVVVYSGAKFEILFDVGMNALKDGYPREAVSSFASSLERFYEFFIKYCAFSNNTSIEVIDKTWKLVSNQSERQLGAYIYTYLAKFSVQPVLLHQKKVTFRNSVIHKGYIPTLQEALDFGESIYDCIIGVARQLEQIEQQKLQEYYNLCLPNPKGYEWTVSESTKAISLNVKHNGKLGREFSEIKKVFKLA